MKTAVETVFVGRDRQFNCRFEQMCGHYLVEPDACTPAAGWEKGQVENQVGRIRGRLFKPRLRFKSYEELNHYLLERCVAQAKAAAHPDRPEMTIWSAFEAERSALIPYPGRFEGFRATMAAVSKTCLVRFDNNRYSVMAKAVGRAVEILSYADRIVIRQDGVIVGEHEHRFGRNQTVFDPWHYAPVLTKKLGALRNGAPFKNWVLPSGLARVRRKLAKIDGGDRQMVDVLAAVPTDGLAAVDAACREALEAGAVSADVVLNALARAHQPPPTTTVATPAALKLTHEPIGNCARYDGLRALREEACFATA